MSLAKEINSYFQSTGQEVFIEVEAKRNRIMTFIDEYNTRLGENLDISDTGIIALDEKANKWGIELRCYFNNKLGFPSGIQITSNRAYRPEYSYRFNDVDTIWELFNMGYRIGKNLKIS